MAADRRRSGDTRTAWRTTTGRPATARRRRPRRSAARPDRVRGRSSRRRSRRQLGRYVVIEEVGRGGMGRVLRAYDPKLQREVALKLLRRTRGGLDEARTRLVREARAMARLSHPNVVAVYDVEETAQRRDAGDGVRRGADAARLDRRHATRAGREIVERFVAAGGGSRPHTRRAAAPRLQADQRAGRARADAIVKVTDFGLAKVASADGTSRATRAASRRRPPRVTTSPASSPRPAR